ncbi:hypothetical protein EKG37_05560 [Robertmurraya yapensis]|uniref:Helix-hairpin-helix DNA-binding motif class 1 domain-containing protein n=1 Tax=Bacillus yapensis TaxID=2492960 RepID=A0A3S0K4C5_9BACI|nr:helix-hairpin-helix domain-containing protein [Bacillus yapensis]RTR35345.1 hypothetical protein EKG37_05560 [Bacillus yapensis]TKS97854.1 hypothetical protein FAR12_05560 [Bacillus yapensis]
MLEWVKNHKQFVVIAALMFILLSYYLVSSVLKPLEDEENGNWEPSSTEPESTVEEEGKQVEEIEEQEILVDVKGAVQNPGVYKATTGDRVIDVIERAGGITEAANGEVVNLAMRVTDEMVIYVPLIGEETESVAGVVSPGGGESDKININKATATELETLSGIGPAKSAAIIEYRETNGPFQTIEDIMSISGFGEKTFEKLKESISVK